MKYLKLLGLKSKLLSIVLVVCSLGFGFIYIAYDPAKYMVIVFILLIITLTYLLVKDQVVSLNKIKELAQAVDDGELPELTDKTRKSGITAHLVSLYNKMQEIVEFVRALDTQAFEFQYINAEGKIGRMLTELSEKQSTFVDQERRRSWKNEGLAKFGEILRVDNQDLSEMSNKVLSNLVRYVGANQGGFFTEFEEDGKRYMQLSAAYAYDRKKFLEMKVEQGQGLLGQVMLEKELIYLTDTPSDFVNITSGLGHATPEYLLIIPLIVNENFYGAIELASFEAFEEYKIEFLTTVAENIASVVAAVKTNEHTRTLLDQSRNMASELQSREEEMRQNMEELQATQEEMQRNQLELDGLFRALNNSQGLAEFSIEGEVLNANDMLLNMLGYSLDALKERSAVLIPKNVERSWQKLQNGENIENELLLEVKGGQELWLNTNYSPISDKNGNVTKVLMLALDITERKHKENEIETLSLVANKTNNSVIITDADGSIEYINPGFEKLSGYTLEEVLGKKPGAILQGKDTNPETVARIGRKLKNREPLYDEILNYHKTGYSYWVSLSISPVMNDAGELTKYVSIQTNITETKEKTLDYHYQLQAINRSNATIEFDPKGNILEANDNFLKIFRYQKEEIIGKHHRIFTFPGTSDTKEYKMFWEKLEKGEFVNQEFKRIDKNGNEIWLRGIYNPIFDLQGKVIKIVKFASDITREKQLQIETLRQQEEIKSHLETIDKTIASLEFDMEGKISYVNEVYLNVSGYTYGELIGNNYEFLLPEGESEKPQTQMMWTSLKDGNFFTGQFQQRSKTGSPLWLRGTFNPILNDEGIPTKVMMFAQFNTQEKEKYDDLTQMVTALKNSAAVLELSIDGVFKKANDKFFEVSGYSRIESRGKQLEFFLDPKMAKNKITSLQKKFKKQEFFEQLLFLETKSGDKKALTATFNPIRNIEGDVVKIVVILFDETIVQVMNPN